MTLTPKQQRFVAEYCVDMNATQAAKRAGYSAKTATMQGSRLLTNDEVRKAIDARSQKVADKLEITAERILGAIDAIAFGKEETKHRLRALDMLARHKSLYNDKLDVTVTDGLAERLERAKGRT